VTAADAEMRHFSRWAFSAARQCGAKGCPAEAETCFRLAMDAAGPERSKGRDFRLYQMASKVIGWKLTGICSQAVDRIRNKTSDETMKLSWMDD
jgi:hypothetical protein